jgi:hypothetical protein
MIKVIDELSKINKEELKKAFDDIKAKDNDEAKKKYYSKAYYQQNKSKYRQYYIDNKEHIKEYAKQYKKQNNKKKSKTNGLKIQYGTFIVSFGFSKTESLEEGAHKSLSQLFFQPQ